MTKGVDTPNLTLEQFASEAAQHVAEQWAERMSGPLHPGEMQALVDSIWECFCTKELQSTEAHACP